MFAIKFYEAWNIFLGAALEVLTLILRQPLQFLLTLIYGPWRIGTHKSGVDKYKIIADLKIRFMQGCGFRRFLLKFEGVESLDVIKNAKLVLYSVNETHYNFAKLPPGVDITNIEEHPFTAYAVHTQASHIYMVSRDIIEDHVTNNFTSLGENITLLHNIGRCGSTLVAAMVCKTKQAVVLSEPFPLVDIAELYHTTNRPEKLKMIRTTLLLLCRDPNKTYFIKVTGVVTGFLISKSHKVLPKINDIFLYRSLVPTMNSFIKIFDSYCYFFIAVMDGMFPSRYQKVYKKLRLGRTDTTKRLLLAMLMPMHHFYLEAEKIKEMKSYSYESLMKDTTGFCRSLLADIGISGDYTELALTALDRDSQENSVLSKEKLAGKSGNISDEIKMWCKEVADKEFGIQLEGDKLTPTNFPNGWELY